MKRKRIRLTLLLRNSRCVVALTCALALIPGDCLSYVAQEGQQNAAAQQPATKLPPEELDSLVAPIALYPDPLLSQTLVASTYPLEIIQLQQFLQKNKSLKDKALTEAVKKQDWDPSVQAMAVLPDVVKQMAENIKWTTDLGNAFLAQQNDVMDAVQRMRTKAKDKGNLKSTEQQKVETQVVENKQVIVIQPSSPEVVYVPSYNPTVVYGPPVYAYPPIAYPPPPPPGYYAAGMAISFGVGMMVGAAWGGGWGWNCGWGGNNNIYINNNNNFVRNTNVQGGNRNYQGGNRVNAQNNRSTWQHNPQHRGGAPYSDRNVANRYGGTARGDSLQQRQSTARQNQTRQANLRDSSSGARPGTSDRSTAAGNRTSTRDSAGNRASTRDSAGGSDRAARNSPSAGTADRGGGGGDRVGNRSVPSSTSSRNSSAFGGGSGQSGSSARASSSRGASSFSGSRGGGSRGSRGGGRRR